MLAVAIGLVLVLGGEDPDEGDTAAAPAQAASAAAAGELTVNGVTRPLTVPMKGSLSDGGLLVLTSSFEVVLADHDVTAPRAGPVLSVADVATVEIQLFLTR